MRELKKWNHKSEQYEEYLIPKEWNVSTYEYNLNNLVSCVQCGKKITFGEGYISKEVRTEKGFGYTVCEKCYEMEWKRERKANENNTEIE